MLGVHGVGRRYGDRTVLDDVSFDVRPGRMTGFVGANGAGKTTTMRIIVGVLAADRRRGALGRRPHRRRRRRRPSATCPRSAASTRR